MKILIDARLYGLENAGLGRYTMNLIHSLVPITSSHQYNVMLRKKYYDLLNFTGNWKSQKADIKHYSLAEQYNLSRLINKENPDIVHFLHFNVPLSYRGKFIVTIHDMIMHQYKGHDTTTLPVYLYSIKRIGYKLIFKNAVNRSVKIIVPSYFVKDELIRNYKIIPEKVVVIYEGVSAKVITKNTRSSVALKYGLEKPYFIYTGNAYPHKNLKRAIEAVVQLNKQSDKKVTFGIVSSRSVFTKRLEQLIHELKAEPYVKLLGFVPDNELFVLYKNSEGFLYPSLYEGFGLPGLEAMSSGTIAIVSDIPVFNEIYKKYAVYFNPYDFSSIVTALKNVLQMTPEERNKHIENGLLLIKKYSWKKMAEQTLKVYDELQ